MLFLKILLMYSFWLKYIRHSYVAAFYFFSQQTCNGVSCLFVWRFHNRLGVFRLLGFHLFALGVFILMNLPGFPGLKTGTKKGFILTPFFYHQ